MHRQRNLIDYICVIYLNDILIYFKTKKKTLIARTSNVEKIASIQILCQAVQMYFHDSICKIFKIYREQSRRFDEFQ